MSLKWSVLFCIFLASVFVDILYEISWHRLRQNKNESSWATIKPQLHLERKDNLLTWCHTYTLYLQLSHIQGVQISIALLVRTNCAWDYKILSNCQALQFILLYWEVRLWIIIRNNKKSGQKGVFYFVRERHQNASQLITSKEIRFVCECVCMFFSFFIFYYLRNYLPTFCLLKNYFSLHHAMWKRFIYSTEPKLPFFYRYFFKPRKKHWLNTFWTFHILIYF